MAYMQLCQSFFFYYAMLLIFCLSLLLLPTANAHGNSNETDMRALLELKSQVTSDPLQVLTSWNSSSHFCLWYGVTCGRKHQRVTELELSSVKLGGSISPHVGNLSFIRVLDMSNNSFRGGIPPQLGRLRKLQILSLDNNSLSGEIPSNLSHCSSLVYLVLSRNNLDGNIPKEIGQLAKLDYLILAANNLSGIVPSSMGNLSSITRLFLSDNGLSGNILGTVGQTGNLLVAALAANHFTGIIPSSISNLTSIEKLDLSDNKFHGEIYPNFFTAFKNLTWLGLSANQFTGTIPSSLSNASNIDTLQMGYNHFEGKVPASLQSLIGLRNFRINYNNLGTGGHDDLKFLCSLRNASFLEAVGMSKNNFGGEIPQCVGNLSSALKYLDINFNQIHGSIPAEIGNLVGLWAVDISYNKLSGKIPESIGNLQYLIVFYIEGNFLSGSIPETIGNLTSLSQLDISDNNLQGIIPSSLGNCQKLQALDLSLNNLQGTLPAEVLGISSLTLYLGFAGNHLTGSLPEEIVNLANLAILDASQNMFSGRIPDGLGKCTSLELLYLGENHFQGFIPASLSSLRGLQELNLFHNNLSGQIPDFLASFRLLTQLNLSFNHFEGMVPSDGVFRNASATSLEGNIMLCGGIAEFHFPACNSHVHKSKDRIKIVIASVSAVVGIGMVWLLVFFVRGKKERVKQTSSSSENPMMNMSYHDLFKATDGFSPENLIGVGTFGSVYKGILSESQKLIAVKVMNLMHHGAAKSFLAECEALKNTRHRNLVKVLSACSSIDHQGHDFKALIYEFMANGSLEEWLHPPCPQGDDAAHQAKKKLSLGQRVNIAIDVASVLEYLHHECDTPLVHCDIKPSNILLDDEVVAHVSDFGIAKFLSADILPSTNNSSSLGVRGTIGYVPPEYGLGSDISTKGDVYSYGILLLEMFTGRRPTNEDFQDEWSLREVAKKSLSEGVDQVIDADVLQEIGGISNNNHLNWSRAVECLTSLIEIGVACSCESPHERINMNEASTILHSIRKKLVHKTRL